MNRPITVFLAEDNRADVFLVREALTAEGLEYELFVAEDGDKAERLLARVGNDVPSPDVLLMDLNLPRAEGPELIRLFREHPGCAKAPFIVITSSDSPKDRSLTAELGVRAFFRKPSELAEFMKLGGLVRRIVSEADAENDKANLQTDSSG